MGWLFSAGLDVARLSHPRISIGSYPPLVRGRLGPLAAYLNRRRMALAYSRYRTAVLVVPTWHLGWAMVNEAPSNGMPVLIRIHSDDDVVPSGPTGGGGRRLLAACRARETFTRELPPVSMVAFLTEQQRQTFHEQADCPSVLIRQGWPIPSACPEREGGDHVLWVGSCRALKKPLLMVELARQIPEERFVMVMPPYAGQQDALYKSVVAAASTVPNLTLIARQLPIDEVDKLFATAKVFVNTSEVEGFPTTFLQAAAAGVPVASLSVDPDGYLVRERAGFVANGDFEELLSAVVNTVQSGAWVEIGRRHWEYSRANHSIEVCAEQLELAIRQCLEDR